MKVTMLSLCCLLWASQMQGQHVFAINDFNASSAELNLCGASAFHQDRLRLTPSTPNQQGASWFNVRKIDITQGFETEFTFLISGASGTPGDGFAFIMQAQSATALGGVGDNIGYKQIPDVMAIEFDTKDDGEGSKNHVNLSFYDPEQRDYRRYATVHEIPEVTDGKAHFTKVIYRDGKLEVYLDSYIFPILSVRIDIAQKINAGDGKAWVGFTSSTSDGHAHHDLLQWSLKEFLPDPESIEEEQIEIVSAHALPVKGRKITVKVWDHNKIDGDIVSMKWGDEWVLVDYKLRAEPHELTLTLHGFEQQLVLFANNIGLIPPNTAMVSIYDGHTYQKVRLDADFETSEAVTVQYRGTD